tara:strand:- start:413 stop:730 length:318 start_codon:yes stop_codon:yes gene_type:complete
MAKYLKIPLDNGGIMGGHSLVNVNGFSTLIKSAARSIDIVDQSGAKVRLNIDPTMAESDIINAAGKSVMDPIFEAVMKLKDSGYTDAVGDVTMPSGFSVKSIEKA